MIWVKEGVTQVARNGIREYRINYVGGQRPWLLTDFTGKQTSHQYIEDAEAAAHEREAGVQGT